jgi:AMP-binding enzyme
VRRPDRDEPATRAAIEPDGWMHTGDIATRDEEGRYFIVDRRKDLIITGRLQAAALGPVRARPAQDLHRQGDAPGAEDPRRLRP